MLAVVHQRGELGPARPQLIGNMSPGLLRGLAIGLQEGLADRSGDHRVLALRHVRQGVAHPMHAAPLPGRTEHAGDRMAQAVASVGDHQLNALETTLDQALQKSRPERFGFGRAEPQADDLAPALAESFSRIVSVGGERIALAGLGKPHGAISPGGLGAACLLGTRFSASVTALEI